MLSPLPEVSPEGSPADAGAGQTAGTRPPLHPVAGAGAGVAPPRRLPPGFSSLGGILSEIETGSPRGEPPIPQHLLRDIPALPADVSQLDTEPTLLSLAIRSPPEGGSQEDDEDGAPHSPMSGTSSGAATMIIHESPAGRFRSHPQQVGSGAIPGSVEFFS